MVAPHEPGPVTAAASRRTLSRAVRSADEEAASDGGASASRQATPRAPAVRRSDAELDRFMAQATQRDRRDAEPEHDDAPQRSFDEMTDRCGRSWTRSVWVCSSLPSRAHALTGVSAPPHRPDRKPILSSS